MSTLCMNESIMCVCVCVCTYVYMCACECACVCDFLHVLSDSKSTVQTLGSYKSFSVNLYELRVISHNMAYIM